MALAPGGPAPILGNKRPSFVAAPPPEFARAAQPVRVTIRTRTHGREPSGGLRFPRRPACPSGPCRHPPARARTLRPPRGRPAKGGRVCAMLWGVGRRPGPALPAPSCPSSRRLSVRASRRPPRDPTRPPRPALGKLRGPGPGPARVSGSGACGGLAASAPARDPRSWCRACGMGARGRACVACGVLPGGPRAGCVVWGRRGFSAAARGGSGGPGHRPPTHRAQPGLRKGPHAASDTHSPRHVAGPRRQPVSQTHSPAVPFAVSRAQGLVWSPWGRQAGGAWGLDGFPSLFFPFPDKTLP